MSEHDDERHPVDQAIELVVFAPLGFALEARHLLPRFVERGRNQIALARVVGKFAVRKGREDAEALLLAQQAQLTEVLRSVGLIPTNTYSGTATTSPPSPSPAAPAPTPPRAAPEDPGVDATELAIPGYDSLSASQVVPRLDSLDDDELELIRRYEHGTRGRKTILSKIAQLQAG